MTSVNIKPHFGFINHFSDEILCCRDILSLISTKFSGSVDKLSVFNYPNCKRFQLFQPGVQTMTDLTLDDIAQMANVSRATVSRVINNHPNVSIAMRQHVQKIIDETNFQPNLAARSLVSRQTKLLGLVIPRSIHGFFSDPYFPRLIEGISQACNTFGYTLSLFIFHTEDDERKIFPSVTQGGFWDGIIVQATGLGDELSPKIADWKIPYIFVGRPYIEHGVSFLDVDNVSGANNAASHLIQLGHRKIATVTGVLDTSVGRDRL
ncbi:MAG: LacI family DNA-binding transcriptional regulator, partial [Candidatus Hermodarchaeia archaeon]